MVWFYDIECMINFFSITFKNVNTKEIKIFVLHESRNNDLNDLYDFLNDKIYLIGYNCLSYDSQLLEFLFENKSKWYYTYPDIKDVIDEIYQCSQETIERLFPKYPEWKLLIPHLDLFKIWHYDSMAKTTSLKAIEVAIRFPNVQDMPFSHNHYVKNNEVEQILNYNLNDVNATEEFYWITKGITNLPLYKGNDKIQLRKDIQNEYGIKCINFNDVKIGDTINKQIYLELSGKKWWDIKNLKTIRSEIIVNDIIAPFINFKSDKFISILNFVKSKVITNTKNGINKTLNFDKLSLELKQGGLHSKDLPDLIKSNDELKIFDFDVDSFYPSTILLLKLYPNHLGKEWLEGYEKMYHQRIYAKKNRKTDKKYETINQALKLSLNGSYGKTGEDKSWQCDKLVTMSTTINCQLFILMIIEELLLNNYNIISCNTDGVTVYCENEKIENLRNIFNIFTEQYKYTFEETEYKLIARTSVNDYLALKSDNKLKLKGDFEIDKEIHKDPSNRIRAIAIARYFVENVSIEETIYNPQEEYKIGKDIFKGFGIFDYCLYVKAKSNQHYNLISVTENSFMLKTELLSKNVRYIISNNGGKLVKIYKEDNSEEGINIGYKCTITNSISDNNVKNYDINYQFYIDECNKIIDKVLKRGKEDNKNINNRKKEKKNVINQLNLS